LVVGVYNNPQEGKSRIFKNVGEKNKCGEMGESGSNPTRERKEEKAISQREGGNSRKGSIKKRKKKNIEKKKRKKKRRVKRKYSTKHSSIETKVDEKNMTGTESRDYCVTQVYVLFKGRGEIDGSQAKEGGKHKREETVLTLHGGKKRKNRGRYNVMYTTRVSQGKKSAVGGTLVTNRLLKKT